MQVEALDSPAAARRAWIAAVALVAVTGAALVATHRFRDRSLVGAHGLLHAAVVFSVLDRGLPPDNPFVAGAPLPYYWGFHAVAAGVARSLGVNPLHAFELLNLAGLALFVLTVTDLGRRLFGSPGRGVLAAGFGLLAVHPLGPVVLGLRILGGEVDLAPAAAIAEPVHPLRDAIYAGDVRYCPNLVWFLNPSGRGPGLGLAAVALWLADRAAVAPRGRRGRWTALLVLAGVALAAFAPLLAFALPAVQAAVGLPCRRARGATLRVALAGAAGAALAAPTWAGILGAAGAAPPFRDPGALPEALLRVGLAGAPLALTAWLGARRAGPRVECTGARGLLAGGLLLFALAVVVRLPEGNEHNLFNLGVLLLALPAAAAFGSPGRAPSRRLVAVAAAVFLPTTVLHLGACWMRTPAGLSFPPDHVGGTADPTRREVYRWLRAEAEAGTVVIDAAWPEDPAPRVAQNVSDLPAATRRALWVDRPSYVVPRTPAAARRARATYRLYRGLTLAPEDRRELEAAPGPLVVICRGPAGRARVERALGGPARVVHAGGTHLVLAIDAGAASD